MTSSLIFKKRTELKAAWDDLKEKLPHLYNRNAAEMLGCKEGELIALECGEKNLRLDIGDKLLFLNGLKAFGKCFWILRNGTSVLEADGSMDFSEDGNIIRGKGELYLMAASKSLAHFFACKNEKFLKRSIQVFDDKGDAIFKVYLSDESLVDAFDKWIAENFVSAKQEKDFDFKEIVSAEDSKGHCCQKTTNKETEITVDSYKTILQAATESEEEILFIVGNHAACQGIRTHVRNAQRMSTWFNIMDEGLHVHIREDDIKKAFVSESEDGKEKIFSYRNEKGSPVLKLIISSDGRLAKETEKRLGNDDAR